MQKEDSPEPTIAVVIAAKNVAEYIEEALESLLTQSILPHEIVVVNDCSEDETAAIVESYAERIDMLKVVNNSTAAGISKSRNIANSMVMSDYIAVLDADDLFDPEAVEKYLEFIKANPKVDLVYADTLVFSDSKIDGNRRHYPIFSNSTIAIRSTLGRPLLPFKHSSMIYRKSSIDKLGGYSEKLRIKVDVELFLRFQAGGMEVKHLGYATSYHRKHNSQVSVERMSGMLIYMDLIRTYEPVLLMRFLLVCIRMPSEFLKFLVKG